MLSHCHCRSRVVLQRTKRPRHGYAQQFKLTRLSFCFLRVSFTQAILSTVCSKANLGVVWVGSRRVSESSSWFSLQSWRFGKSLVPPLTSTPRYTFPVTLRCTVPSPHSSYCHGPAESRQLLTTSAYELF
jgi:hypothetical protein